MSSPRVVLRTPVEPSRETEVGTLPVSWKVAPLGDLFHVQQGKALSPAAKRGVSPRPFLRTANVLWGRLDLGNVDEMDFSEDEAERLSLHAGDLLVCEGGEVGRTAIWQGEIQGCSYQNHVHRLRRKGVDCVPEFVMYWMQAGFLQLGLYGGAANRTTIPNISGARLKQLPIPLPSAEEQRGIAGILSAIQAAMEVQDKIVATLKELKAATMAKLFREGAIRGLMFDTNVFDDLVDGRLPVSDLPKGVPIFATHVQSDEIEGCPDAERRVQLQALVRNLSERIPTASFVLGVSRLDEARLGDGSMFDTLCRGAGKRRNDALIAETAVKERLVVVTNDRDLRTRVRGVGGETIDTQELVRGKLRPMKQTEVGEIPESWELVELSKVARIERGKFSHRPRNDPRFYGGTVPFIQTGDVAKCNGRIRTYSQTLNEEGLAISRLFPKGTIVLTIAANIADTGILEFDSAFPDSLVGISADQTVDPAFLECYLRTQKREMDRLAPKGTQKNINIQFLKPWPLPRPRMEEQRTIAHILRSVDDRLEVASRRLNEARAFFSSMLYLLMTGQVRVPVPTGAGREQIGGQAASGWQSRELAGTKTAPEKVERFVAELVRRFEPERVILFGEHAKGSPRAFGEVGLLVEMDFEGLARDQAARMAHEIPNDFSLDLIVRRPEDVARAVEMGDAFIKGVLERGRTLYVRPSGVPARREKAPRRETPPRRGRVSEETLREIVQRIVETVQPERIILFGSAARGEMGPDSDVDLMVVKTCQDRREVAQTIYRALRGIAAGLPKDVVVVTPEDVERDRDTIGYIIRPAVREGRVVYAA